MGWGSGAGWAEQVGHRYRAVDELGNRDTGMVGLELKEGNLSGGESLHFAPSSRVRVCVFPLQVAGGENEGNV